MFIWIASMSLTALNRLPK